MYSSISKKLKELQQIKLKKVIWQEKKGYKQKSMKQDTYTR